MAKTNEKAKVAAKDNGAKKTKKFDIVGFFKGIGRFFREVISELKKVSWPSRKELTSYSIAVLVFIAICVVITFVMDTGLSAAVNLLFK